MPADFNTAIKQFEAGRHAEAANTCRAILAEKPGDLSASNMLGVIAASQGDFAEATECFRACALAAPNDVGVVSNFAQALLETGETDQALTQFKRAGRLQGSDIDVRIMTNAHMDAPKSAMGEPYVETLRNVVVETGYWGVLDDEKIYFRETANLNPRNSPLIKGRLTQDLSSVVINLPMTDNEITTPCVLLGGDENYAHWLTRYLMRLALIETNDTYGAMPFLTIDSLKQYQQDSLDLLGIDDSRLIKVPRHSAVRCASLVVPVCLRTDTKALSVGIRWLREKFLPEPRPQNTATPTRLFVSRRDAPSRHMSNEEEVIEALRPFGFQAVRLSEHSFADQIAMFSNAEMVVAPHGAGLANMIFAPAQCALIEIVSGPIANMNDFRLIGQVLGQPVSVVESQSFKVDAGATNPAAQHSFTADPGSIVDAVRQQIG
ncbi:MAG: glycosyltransferase 61 family protein [Alphaproteobacteria bacterium]